MPTTGSSGRFYAEWYCASIEPIRSFLASHCSRRDSETSWLLDLRTPTNPMDTFTSSLNTKRSMLEADCDMPSQAGCLRIWPVYNRNWMNPLSKLSNFEKLTRYCVKKLKTNRFVSKIQKIHFQPFPHDTCFLILLAKINIRNIYKRMSWANGQKWVKSTQIILKPVFVALASTLLEQKKVQGKGKVAKLLNIQKSPNYFL